MKLIQYVRDLHTLGIYDASTFIHKLISRGLISWPTGLMADSKEEFLRFCLLSFPTMLHSLDEHNIRVTYVFGIGQLGQSFQYEHEAKSTASIAMSIHSSLNSTVNGFNFPPFLAQSDQTIAILPNIESCVSELSKLSSWAINQIQTWLLTSALSSCATATPIDTNQAEIVCFHVIMILLFLTLY